MENLIFIFYQTKHNWILLQTFHVKQISSRICILVKFIYLICRIKFLLWFYLKPSLLHCFTWNNHKTNCFNTVYKRFPHFPQTYPHLWKTYSFFCFTWNTANIRSSFTFTLYLVFIFQNINKNNFTFYMFNSKPIICFTWNK